MDLLVIIVNYGTSDHVLTNLETLVPDLRSLDCIARCWIVDNNSPDNSTEILGKAIITNEYQDIVTLISHSVNAGFGAGNNVAISKAFQLKDPPDYFYLLNPDAIALSGTIDKLCSHLERNSNIGVVGGPVLNADSTHNCGAFRFPSYLSTLEESLSIGPISTLLKNFQTTITPSPQQNIKVDWVSGASMMVSREALEKAGSFDEDFFLYFEEVDLCKRITQRGLEIEYLPEAPVTHVGGVSTGIGQPSDRLPEYWHRSRRLYLKKHFGSFGLFLHNMISLITGPIGLVYKRMRGRKDLRPFYLRDILKYNFLETNNE